MMGFGEDLNNVYFHRFETLFLTLSSDVAMLQLGSNASAMNAGNSHARAPASVSTDSTSDQALRDHHVADAAAWRAAFARYRLPLVGGRILVRRQR